MGLRVVLDTNVWVSALLWKGYPHKILMKALDGEIGVVTSTDILDEVERVLHLEKFGLTDGEVRGLMKVVYGVSDVVKIVKNFEVNIKDRDDLIVIDCGLNGKTSFIMTGDDELLSIKKVKDVKILNPKKFLDKLQEVRRKKGV